MVMINKEVVDAPLDYNILLGHSFMYAMKVVASFVFHVMMFPPEGKVVTIDHLTHHETRRSSNLNNVLPSIEISCLTHLILRKNLESSKTQPYWGHTMALHYFPPPFPSPRSTLMCTATSREEPSSSRCPKGPPSSNPT